MATTAETDEASGAIWCRSCKESFLVVGSRRRAPSATPAIEMVVCPYCRSTRRMILPPEVDSPVVRTLSSDRNWS